MAGSYGLLSLRVFVRLCLFCLCWMALGGRLSCRHSVDE
jgi:hypothetical protein